MRSHTDDGMMRVSTSLVRNSGSTPNSNRSIGVVFRINASK